MTVPLQIWVSVGWRPVHCSAETAIWLGYDQSVQTRHGSITPADFHGELDSVISGLNMFYETVLCADWMTTNVSPTNLLHRLGGCSVVLWALTSNCLHKHVCSYGAYGRAHSSSFNLHIVPALKNTDDIVDSHRCSFLKFLVIFQMYLDDLYVRFYGHWCK